jgi:hypothetical protein
MVLGLRFFALVLAAGLGWLAHGGYADAQRAEALRTAITARDTALAKAEVKGREADEARQSADRNHFLLTQEIAKHAKKSSAMVAVGTLPAPGAASRCSTVDVVVPRLADDFLCLYDAALSGADGSECQFDGTPAGASELEPGDILPVHAENARRWQDCRLRFNALIDSLRQDEE